MKPEMKQTFALAQVQTAESDDPRGEFEVILSAETLDRDGEVIDSRAFEPLPDSIPFHAFHDFHDPIGRGTPYYADDGTLRARGVFASTPRAQEIRTLVSEGVIGHTSVGFMGAVRKDGEGAAHVTTGELLEGSFVSVPSNREAAVLLAKGYAGKAGARNSAGDIDRLQTIHDMAVENGAACAAKSARPVSSKAADDGSGYTVGDRVQVNIDPPHAPGQDTGTIAEVGGVAYGIVFDAMPDMGVHRWYVADELVPSDEPAPEQSDDDEPADMPGMSMDSRGLHRPATAAPETPGRRPGKSPASENVVEAARIRARAALLAAGQ